jgi:ABC-type multidrug transport system ATPase subunit
MEIHLQNLGKRYFNTWIFKGLSADFTQGSRTAILGINGSGKSTLLQCITGHISATEGKVFYKNGNKNIDTIDWHQHLGFCSPSMQIIEEFTLQNFLAYHFKFKKSLLSVAETINYLGLTKAADKKIEVFSSGMKQRVKLAQAIMVDTPICFLDEPCSNLDEQGIALYHKMITDFASNKTIFVSSNAPEEYSFCTKQILVQQYQK